MGGGGEENVTEFDMFTLGYQLTNEFSTCRCLSCIDSLNKNKYKLDKKERKAMKLIEKNQLETLAQGALQLDDSS